MRNFQKKLAAAAAGASLIAVIGAAWAQAQQVGPDADMSNNETKTGIQNNSNNSYKTWPQSLSNLPQQQSKSAPSSTPVRQVSQAPTPVTNSSTATDNSTSAASSVASADTSSSTDTSPVMPAPKADRN